MRCNKAAYLLKVITYTQYTCITCSEINLYEKKIYMLKFDNVKDINFHHFHWLKVHQVT